LVLPLLTPSLLNVIISQTVEVLYYQESELDNLAGSRRFMFAVGQVQYLYPRHKKEMLESKFDDSPRMSRWLQEDGLQEPGFEFSNNFMVLPFRCFHGEIEVYPGNYLEIECNDGDGSVFIYCDTNGWNDDMRRGYCENMPEYYRPIAAPAQQESNDLLIFILLALLLLMCFCCLLICKHIRVKKDTKHKKKNASSKSKRKNNLKRGQKQASPKRSPKKKPKSKMTPTDVPDLKRSLSGKAKKRKKKKKEAEPAFVVIQGENGPEIWTSNGTLFE